MKRKSIAIALAISMILTGFPGDTFTASVSAKTKISISKKKLTLKVGQKKTLKIKGTKKKVKWSSTKKKVATVSKKGVVTAKKAGKATIKAKVAKKTYKCTVTVKKKTATATQKPAANSTTANPASAGATPGNSQTVTNAPGTVPAGTAASGYPVATPGQDNGQPTEKPNDPATARPVTPATPKPADPSDPKPVTPATPKPADPSDPKPVTPATQKPSTDASATPAPTPDVFFFRESGTYNDAFDLTLESKSGSDIYYTTDGSNPATSSTRKKYAGSISVKSRKNDKNVLAATDPKLLETFLNPRNYDTNKPDIYSNLVAPSDDAVDKCTVIKAVSLDSDGKASPVMTNTYFIGNMSEHIDGIADTVKASGKNLSVISISMDQKDLFDNDTGIYVKGKYFYDSLKAALAEGTAIDQINTEHGLTSNFKQRGKEWERAAHIEYFETDGTNTTCHLQQDCGIRIQGNYSREAIQKSFRLYAKEKYGVKNFKYPFFDDLTNNKGEVIKKFKTLVLRQGGNDVYQYKYKDLIMQSFLHDTDCWSLYGRPCVVYLDGEYWGYYILQDDVSDNMMQEQYGVKKEDVVVYKGTDDPRYTSRGLNYKLDEGKLPDGEDDEGYYLWDTMRYVWDDTKDFSKDSVYQTFCDKYVSEESFLDYFASMIYLNNSMDWPGKNWMMWRTTTVDTSETAVPQSDGRWRLMYNDLDLTTTATWNTSLRDEWQQNPLYAWWANRYNEDQNVIGSIFGAMMENKNFRDKLSAKMKTMANETFSQDKVTKTGELYRTTYSPLYWQFLNRFAPEQDTGYGWGRITSECRPEENHQSNMDFLKKRPEYLNELCRSIENWGNDDNGGDNGDNGDNGNTYDTPAYNPDTGYIWEGRYNRNGEHVTTSCTQGMTVVSSDDNYILLDLDWNTLENPVVRLSVEDGYAENARTHIWGGDVQIGYFYQNGQDGSTPWIGQEIDISALKNNAICINCNDSTITKIEIYNKEL